MKTKSMFGGSAEEANYNKPQGTLTALIVGDKRYPVNTNGTATITVNLDFNVALLLYQSAITLGKLDIDAEDYTQEELIAAWTKAIQHRLDAWARDTDHFLDANGNEEVFLDALAVA